MASNTGNVSIWWRHHVNINRIWSHWFYLQRGKVSANYINPGYGLSLLDTLWNASSYPQPLEQEGNPMT